MKCYYLEREKESGNAPKRRQSTEQIIMKLREAEVMIAQGRSIAEVARQLGVSKQTYYRWRHEYGGLDTTQAKKLRELGVCIANAVSWLRQRQEQENGRLKNLVADLSLDKAILKEVLSKK